MSDTRATAELIGSADAERILDVSRATLTRWVADGKLAVLGKLRGPSGAFVFDRAAVEDLADQIRADREVVGVAS